MAYTAEKPPIARSSEELRRTIPGWGADLDPKAVSPGTLSCVLRLYMRHGLSPAPLLDRAAAYGRTSFEHDLVVGFGYMGPHPAKAIAHLRAAHAHRPDAQVPLRLLADLYYRAGDGDAAIGAWARASELAPDTDVWRSLGLMYRRKKDPAAAIRAFREAVRLAPANPELRLDTSGQTPSESAAAVLEVLAELELVRA